MKLEAAYRAAQDRNKGASSSARSRRYRPVDACSVTPRRSGTASGLLTVALAAAAMLIGIPLSSAQSSGSPQVRTNLTSPSAPDDTSALAEKFQNPIADLISFPFQNNTNFNVGPNKGTQDILNIQPVIPIHLNQDWNVITRTILPLVWNPSYAPASVSPAGIEPTVFSAFFSPRNAGAITWGVGPAVQIPTATSATLGSNVWGLGPAAVVVWHKHPWVTGALVNNVFSLGGTTGHGGTQYSQLTIQPFANYNFGHGWFVGSVPIITASWDTGGEKWTLPVGGQFGRLIMIGGKQPVNLLLGAYYNALRPQGGGTWQLRTQIAVIF